jgi:hypothetical protein
LAIGGNADGQADVVSYDGGGTSNTIRWSMLATNSAHFSMESLTPGVSLTLASGCSVSSGYGCDPLPVPEPPSALLWMLGTAGLAVTRRNGVRGA